MLPTLYADRVKRYESIAESCGYTVTMSDLNGVDSEAEFSQLIEKALAV